MANDTMNTSLSAEELIKNYETLRLDAHYVGNEPNLTIGWGHYNDPLITIEGQVITESQAQTFLEQDLLVAENIVKQRVTVELTQNRFGALVRGFGLLWAVLSLAIYQKDELSTLAAIENILRQ